MSQRTALVAVVVVAVLVLGAVFAIMRIDASRTPEAAVRDYLELVAKGDGPAADARVAPGDRAAATALRSATSHIAIGDVSADPTANGSETVPVDVDYTVAGRPANATLRVRKVSSSFGVLTRWRVIDPLVVPVNIQTAVPSLATAYVGAARLPADGQDTAGYPQHTTRLYPGVYPVRGRRSAYLSAPPTTVTVGPEIDSPHPVTVPINYAPTDRLRRLVTRKANTYIRACVAAGRKMPRDCPLSLRARADAATHMKITQRPRLEKLEPVQTRPHSDDPPLYFSTYPLSVTYTSTDGTTDHEDIPVCGGVDVTARDIVTVTFDCAI